MIYRFPRRFAYLLSLLLFAGSTGIAQQTVQFQYEGHEGSVRVHFLLFATSTSADQPDLEAVSLSEYPLIDLSDYHSAYILVRLSDLRLERRRDHERYYLEVPELLINFGPGLQRRPIPGKRLILTVEDVTTIADGRARADIRYDVDQSIKTRIRHDLTFGFNLKRVSDGGVVTHISSVKQSYTLAPARKRRPAVRGESDRDISIAEREKAREEFEAIADLPPGAERSRRVAVFTRRWEKAAGRSAEIKALISDIGRLEAESGRAVELRARGITVSPDTTTTDPLASLEPPSIMARPENGEPAELPIYPEPEGALTPAEAEARQQEEQAWRETLLLNTRDAYESYLQTYGDTAIHTAAAQVKLTPFEVVIQSREARPPQSVHFEMSIAGSEGKTPRLRIIEGNLNISGNRVYIDDQELIATIPAGSKVGLELTIDGSPWKTTSLTLDASPTPLTASFGPVENGSLALTDIQGGSPPYYLEVLDIGQRRRIINIVELGDDDAYTIQLSKLLKHTGSYRLRLTDRSHTAMASLESVTIDYEQPPLISKRTLFVISALLVISAMFYFGRQTYLRKREIERTRAYMRRLKSELQKNEQLRRS